MLCKGPLSFAFVELLPCRLNSQQKLVIMRSTPRHRMYELLCVVLFTSHRYTCSPKRLYVHSLHQRRLYVKDPLRYRSVSHVTRECYLDPYHFITWWSRKIKQQGCPSLQSVLPNGKASTILMETDVELHPRELPPPLEKGHQCTLMLLLHKGHRCTLRTIF